MLVIGYYEVINGELKIADPKIEALVFILSMLKLGACLVIFSCWFMFRYQCLREDGGYCDKDDPEDNG